MTKIYLVAHSHYDAAWVFTKEDYLYINIEGILKKVIELIDRYDYKFLIEQAVLLQEIERRTPQLFESISRFVKEGKIEIASGEYLMPDTMIPSGETLVRVILIGKMYIRSKFGVEPTVVWGADSFGYNAQMPQIYVKSGYKYFAFRRGVDSDKASEFWWQGLDGTRILAHWMPLGYRAGLDLESLDESLIRLKELAITGHILMPAGSGSVPPQAETMAAVKKWNRNHKDSRMKITRCLDFFQALEQEASSLEVRKGAMYSGKYSKIFPDCCSSRMWLKQNLRKYEQMMLACERWATVSWLLGVPYPVDEFLDNWKKILWGAFHDIASGTGMDESYQEARDNFTYLQTHLPVVLINLLEVVSANLEAGADVIVFNSLSWEVKNWVELDLGFNKGKIKRISGLRSGKENIEVEILEFTRYDDDSYQTVKIGFVATVPAMGYRTYKILKRGNITAVISKIRIKGNTVRNQFFQVQVNPSNGLIDVFMDGKKLVWGNEIVLEEEIGDLYYHRQNLNQPLRTEGGEGVNYGKFRIKGFKIEKCPVRRVINIQSDYYSVIWPYRFQEKLRPVLWRHNYLSISKKIIIYDDLPRIDFVTTVNNHHPQVRIRARFSTDVSAPKYHTEAQFGVVEHATNQFYATPRGKWEEKPTGIFPALNWIDYSDDNKGVTLINQGLPEHEVRDNSLYLTLLRSILMLSSDGITGPAIPTPDAQEFKTCTFKYSLFPHRKGWKESDCFKPAHEFNYGLAGFQISGEKGNGKLPPRFSFLEIKPENLIISALKKAEGADEVILRFFETKGKETRGEIVLFKEPKSVKMVNLMENEEGQLEFQSNKIAIKVKPFEIVSLKIRF
ncbi:alpha-mannosidase [Chloroflexota bacterium]